jgi:hypothetical protein
VVGVFVVARVVRFVKRVELTMFNHWTKALKRERTDIETDLDVELEWERLPEKQASRIKQPKDLDGTINELITCFT